MSFDHLSHLSFIQVRVPCGVSVAGFYVIYQQHIGQVVHSQAMKAHAAAEVQLLSFLLSAPSRFDAGAHWKEGPVVPRARVGVLQTRTSLLLTCTQSTDHPARSPVIILTYDRVGLLLHGIRILKLCLTVNSHLKTKMCSRNEERVSYTGLLDSVSNLGFFIPMFLNLCETAAR